MIVSKEEERKDSDSDPKRSMGNTSRGGTVPLRREFSAAELAALKLPGLPGTKARIIERAASEGWGFTEAKGVGGTRRIYTVPEHYLLGRPQLDHVVPGDSPIIVVGSEENSRRTQDVIAAGSRADPELLALAVQAVEEWCQETGKTLTPGRKGAVISVLYDYLIRGGGEVEVRSLLQAVG